LFFHYFTVHGSGPNEANTGRKTVLVQMHAGDDIPEATTNHPNARLVLSGRNRLVGRATAGESS
jgi:hypothetical protein